MREAFQEAMVLAPNDPTTWLVYADWLDENGHEREAAWRREIASRMRPYDETVFRVNVRTFAKRGTRNDRYRVEVAKNGHVVVHGQLSIRKRLPTEFEYSYSCWAAFTTWPLNPMIGPAHKEAVRCHLWQRVLVNRVPGLLPDRLGVRVSDDHICADWGTKRLWIIPVDWKGVVV